MKTARIKRTGQMLYSSDINDLNCDAHCWFNLPDGNHRDCTMVMDNKQFRRMVEDGEIEIIQR